MIVGAFLEGFFEEGMKLDSFLFCGNHPLGCNEWIVGIWWFLTCQDLDGSAVGGKLEEGTRIREINEL